MFSLCVHLCMVCLNVCVCAGVNAHCAHACRGPKLTLSIFIHSLLDGGLSDRTWTLLIPVSLVCQFVLGITCLYLLSARITGGLQVYLALTWVVGIRAPALTLVWQVVYPLSQLSSPNAMVFNELVSCPYSKFLFYHLKIKYFYIFICKGVTEIMNI